MDISTWAEGYCLPGRAWLLSFSLRSPTHCLAPKETAETQEYKVKTELMEVRAVVTDRQNRIVENLQKEDFELLDRVGLKHLQEVARTSTQTMCRVANRMG